MNIVDLILIIIIAVVAIASARKGFLLSLFNIASYVISGILSKIFSAPVASFLYGNYFSEKILMKLHELMPSGSVEGELNTVILNALEALPDFVMSMISHFDMFNLNATGDASVTGSALTVDMIEQTYVAPLVSNVLSVIVMVALFVLFSVVLRFVFSLINRLITGKKHKLIRGTNMFLGAALGVVKGSVIAGIICAVLNIAAPILNNPNLQDFVSGSAICNIIANLLK